MRYMGGKRHIAKHVEGLVLALRGDRTVYVEPFLGGAATFSRIAPHFREAWGADVVPDLVMMWEAAVAGWAPPMELLEDEYQALRNAEPSALRGFAGFGCSFGGKWFGGYGRCTPVPGTKTVSTPVEQSARAVVKQAQAMSHAQFRVSDYRKLTARPDMVVYADPPYAGTTGYKGTPDWDGGEFWTHAEKWADAGALVVVSEYAAPPGWRRVWEREMPNYLRGDSERSLRRVEAMFTRDT